MTSRPALLTATWLYLLPRIRVRGLLVVKVSRLIIDENYLEAVHQETSKNITFINNLNINKKNGEVTENFVNKNYSVEFSNYGESVASGESGSSVDSDKSFNLFNRQKCKFKICGRWNEKLNSFLDDVVL